MNDCQVCGQPAAIADPTLGAYCGACAPTVPDLARVALSEVVAALLLEGPPLPPLDAVVVGWADRWEVAS